MSDQPDSLEAGETASLPPMPVAPPAVMVPRAWKRAAIAATAVAFVSLTAASAALVYALNVSPASTEAAPAPTVTVTATETVTAAPLPAPQSSNRTVRPDGEVRENGAIPGGVAERDVKILNQGLGEFGSQSAYKITCQITNNGTDDADYFVVYDVLDKDGDYLGTAICAADRLGSGKSKTDTGAFMKGSGGNGTPEEAKAIKLQYVTRKPTA
ncbi:hypothetical protein ACFWBN_37620 [Streptomyces sp. NPDC059989]|uniref:hypothetical protein n=1 Tax=Streptomyces sp. NPDC059989 TaxID=3347026 RepID=UPI0036CF9085